MMAWRPPSLSACDLVKYPESFPHAPEIQMAAPRSSQPRQDVLSQRAEAREAMTPRCLLAMEAGRRPVVVMTQGGERTLPSC
ncbi:hypothetical protein E2C01_062177 [Portunus trituberculatus]|uniref:Uncharacterized protein n=1 Tax=Portunus trituberculatus TaxID=210409 RepID=A0A5B7HGD4_PORTR|nr:hypothetical protein [Portunus trituberculatus]